MSDDPTDGHTDGPYDDQTGDGYDDSTGGFFSPMTGWPGVGAAEERRYDEYDGDAYDQTRGAGGTGNASWWDEEVISLLLVVGLVLFLFPEPATSAVGILLMSAGVVAWIVDWLA